MSTSIETLIIALRDSRRRHLDARLERDAYIFATARALHEKGGTWTAATMEATNTKRGIDLERAASNAYHDCEELLWRLRWALKPSDEPEDEDPATT